MNATRCRHTEGPGHDCAYVDLRESLIPEAERLATAHVLSVDPSEAEPRRTDEWTRRFMVEMDRLVRDAQRRGRQ